MRAALCVCVCVCVTSCACCRVCVCVCVPPDPQVGNTPVDPAYANLTHHPNKWAIPWAEDDPGLTAPELWLNRTLMHAQEAQSYNVTGLLMIHWRTRAVSPQVEASFAYSWNPSVQVCVRVFLRAFVCVCARACLRECVH